MNKLSLISLSVLLIVGLLLVGCAQPTPQPAPAPAPAPASAPAPKPAPAATVAPAPAAVTPSPTSAVTAKPIELRFSHHNPPNARTTVKMLNPFAKQIEDATKGRVKVTIYPAESLAKSAENIQAVSSGLADLAWLNLGNWTGRFPLTELLNLPFIAVSGGKVDGRVLSSAAANSRIIQELYEKLPEIQAEFADFKILCVHTSDAHFLGTTKKPVRNLNDIKGLKISVFGKYPLETYKLLGATATVLPGPDVYDAAQKGVIDGMGINWGLVAVFRFHEVCKYYTDVATSTSIFAMAMNKDKWNSLPPDIQQAIMSVGGVKGAEFAGEGSSGFGVKEDADAMMQKAGKVMQKVDLEAGEYDKWKATGKSMLDNWLKANDAKGGKKIYDELLKLQEKYKN